MTAEVLYPSRIAVIERDQFLGFMARHPEVYQVVTQELSLQYKVACEQLRTVALAGSAPEKLARLLLDWSENGQKTEAGFRFRFSLTHEEAREAGSPSAGLERKRTEDRSGLPIPVLAHTRGDRRVHWRFARDRYAYALFVQEPSTGCISRIDAGNSQSRGAGKRSWNVVVIINR
jgi:hypothetical protein